MIKKNKKAVSLMVSYTLLVVIAIGLSVVVYGYLKLYLPSQRPQCPMDINLIVEEATCDLGTGDLTITLSNRGLFNVSAAYIRMGEPDRTVRLQANKGREIFEAGPMAPSGGSATYIYDISDIIGNINSNDFILEVQPAIIEKRTLYPCEKSIIAQSITCS